MKPGLSPDNPRPTRVLAVDDEKAFIDLVGIQLQRTGRYEVRCLYEGKDVIRTATTWSPDVILLDYVLPDIDGGRIFQLLKSQPELERIPVILLTALAEEDTPLETGMRPRRLTLTKPVNFKKLEEAIQALTDTSYELKTAV